MEHCAKTHTPWCGDVRRARAPNKMSCKDIFLLSLKLSDNKLLLSYMFAI